MMNTMLALKRKIHKNPVESDALLWRLKTIHRRIVESNETVVFNSENHSLLSLQLTN